MPSCDLTAHLLFCYGVCENVFFYILLFVTLFHDYRFYVPLARLHIK